MTNPTEAGKAGVRFAAVMAAFALCACSPSPEVKHWDSLPPLSNEQITAQINLCWSKHTLPFQHDNSFGEAVKIECYVTDGTPASKRP